MVLQPRIRLKDLAALCRRLAIVTKAGLEDRRIWRDEAARGSRSHQQQFAKVADALATGDSIVVALARTDAYLPPLFRQMVTVGEISGNLDRTYHRLAEHYEQMLKTQREFSRQLAWPLFQLAMAAFVVGLLIWIMGILPGKADGSPAIDLLGFGLYGTRGLIVYLSFLIALALAGIWLFESIRRGASWMRPIQASALALPVLGDSLKTLCLGRFTWALQLVLDSPMDLRKALPLAFDAAGADYYSRHGPFAATCIERGMTIQQTLAATEVFPRELLDAIGVGEEAGALVETMQRQASEYEQRSAAAIGMLAQIAGYAVWFGVAAILIVLIFRIFTVAYLDPIRNAL